ncbi:MAG: zinc ribbon domain-containing protein [Halobacteriales archaeon]|nr:zinc ribbon domain-containing protein [Halobacteriales archaeon]
MRAYTSQTCHACGTHRSSRVAGGVPVYERGLLRCTEYQANINAAANIAGRVDPWERASRLTRRSAISSPRDGSGCVHRHDPRVRRARHPRR